MRYLNFRAQQGLCNRIVPLLCAMGAAETTRRRLLVTWETKSDFEATPDDLWEHRLRLVGWLPARLLIRLGGRPTTAVEALRGRRPVVFTTPVRSFAEELQPRPWLENYAGLQLLPALRERVDAVAQRLWPHPVLGVSVRAHPSLAHTESLQLSPVSWYEARIGAILGAHPGVRVLVSADTPEVVQRWETLWPGRMFALPGKGPYGSIRGVQDALCDVHLLAGCAYILGAHKSSMSEFAGEMRGLAAFETSQRPAGIGIAQAFAERPVWQAWAPGPRGGA